MHTHAAAKGVRGHKCMQSAADEGAKDVHPLRPGRVKSQESVSQVDRRSGKGFINKSNRSDRGLSGPTGTQIGTGAKRSKKCS